MSTSIPGGWSDWQFPVDGPALEIFEKAMDGLLGVNYEPLAFATRATSKEDYVYLCTSTVVAPGAPTKLALVFATSAPQPELGGIKILPLDITGNPGAYQSLEVPPSPEARKDFEQAMEPIIGVDYTPMAVTSKVDGKGLHYIFLAKGVVVNPNKTVLATLVYVTKAGGNEPELKDIKRVLPSGIEQTS